MVKRGDNPLTVGDLLEYLATLDPLAPVVVSADAEGNRFGFLAEACEMLYDDFDDGCVYDVDPDPEADEDDQAPDEAVRALLLWPT